MDLDLYSVNMGDQSASRFVNWPMILYEECQIITYNWLQR